MYESTTQRITWALNKFSPCTTSPEETVRLLDVCACKHNQGCSEIIRTREKTEYTCLNLQKVPGADIVPALSYQWEDVADQSFNIIISAHSLGCAEFFWHLWDEMLRALRPGGILLIVESRLRIRPLGWCNGWRFTKEAAEALAQSADLDILHVSENSAPSLSDTTWFDEYGEVLLVAQKPAGPDWLPVTSINPTDDEQAETTGDNSDTEPEGPFVPDPGRQYPAVAPGSLQSANQRVQWFADTFLAEASWASDAAILEIAWPGNNPYGKSLPSHTILELQSQDELLQAMRAVETASVNCVFSVHALQRYASFWLIVKEAARILKPDGLLCLIAPYGCHPISGGPDFYRFDAAGLCALARYLSFDILHASRGSAPANAVPEEWFDEKMRDAFLVARKPLDWQAPLDLSAYHLTYHDIKAAAEPFSSSVADNVLDILPKKPKLQPTEVEALNAINKLSQKYAINSYLEFNHRGTVSFLYVDIPEKTIICPVPVLGCENFTSQGYTLEQQTANDFFARLGKSSQYDAPETAKPQFDCIFINQTCSFDDSYKIFTESLPFSHKNTLWIIDGTVPDDPYSLLTPRNISLKVRQRAGLAGKGWQGDTYKTIFAIHDFHPDFSYCTLAEARYTFIWRCVPSDRKPVFGSMQVIQQLGYMEIIQHAALLALSSEKQLLGTVGLSLNPILYDSGNHWKKLFFSPLTTLRENEFEKELSALQKNHHDQCRTMVKTEQRLASLQSEKRVLTKALQKAEKAIAIHQNDKLLQAKALKQAKKQISLLQSDNLAQTKTLKETRGKFKRLKKELKYYRKKYSTLERLHAILAKLFRLPKKNPSPPK